MIVGTLLAVLSVMVNDSFTPSTADELLIVTVGYVLGTSVIVPVPVTAVFNVLPELTVAVNVKVSFDSTNASTVASTVTVAVVCPAGIVTVV